MTVAAPAREIRVVNPATGEEVGRVPAASRAEVAAAVDRARAAQGGWEALGFRGRARILARFHDLLVDRAEEVLDTIQRETGKTRRDALSELLTLAGTARYYLAHGAAPLRGGRRRPALPLLTLARVVYKPHGVAGFISPWNYPLLLALGDAVPALLAGNAAVVKPAERTPLSAEVGRRLLLEAGLPEDVLQLVHGPGNEVGAELVRRVDYVGFTGGTATGRAIAVAAGERLVPYSLELGGKNPMIVLRGAPLDEAVSGLLAAAFANAGQLCIAVERAYVEEPIWDEFVARAAERTRRLRLGWSLGWDVDVGSQISAEHAGRVLRAVGDAVAAGAGVAAGGRRRDDLGPTFVEPTLLTDVPDDLPAARQEIFGPVVALRRVRDAEEALRLANDSEYGLNASVWGGNGREAFAVARRLETGSAGVNSALLVYHTFDAPLGGVKASGIGRRHGPEGILRFTQAQSIVRSVAAGGGYESLLVRATTPARARLLLRAFKLWRRIPGLR